MDHASHEPGTVSECPECLETAYEPGWYSLLRRLSESPESRALIAVPDPDDEAFILQPSAES